MRVDVKYNLKILYFEDERFPELVLTATCVSRYIKNSFCIDLLSRYKNSMKNSDYYTNSEIYETEARYKEYMLWLKNLNIKDIIMETNNQDLLSYELSLQFQSKAADKKIKIENDLKEYIKKEKFSYNYKSINDK